MSHEENTFGEPEESMNSDQQGLMLVETLEDSGQVSSVYLVPNVGMDKGIFPLDDETYEGLTREYLYRTLAKQTGSTNTIYACVAPITHGRLPSQILKKFSYFRTDWHIKLQLVAPALSYGFLTGTICPLKSQARWFYKNRGSGLSPGPEDLQRIWSSVSGFTLSVQEQETIEFDLPWPWPGQMVSLGDYDNYEAFVDVIREAWQINIVANSILQITDDPGSPTARINMYVSLKDPIFTGPTFKEPDLNIVVVEEEGPYLLNNFTIPVVEGQAAPNRQAANPMANMGQGIEGMMRTGSAMLNYVMQGEGAMSKIGPIAMEMMAHKAQQALEANESSAKKGTQAIADENTRSGVRQSVYGNTAAYCDSASFQNIGDVPNDCVVDPSYAGAPGSIPHDFLALAKRWHWLSIPAPDQATKPRIYYVTPQIHTQFNANSSNTPGTTSADQNEYGYAAFGCRFYRFWSGNIDYKMECFGSPLIFAKVIVSTFWTRKAFMDTMGDNPTDTEIIDHLIEGGGDVYTQTFSVKGRTTVEWTIPYLKPIPWSDVTHIDNWTPIMAVAFFEVKPSTIGSASVSIPNIISVRPGSNFKFNSYSGGKAVSIGQGPFGKVVEGQGFLNDDSEVISKEGAVNFSTAPNPLDFQASPTNFYQLLRRPGLEFSTYPSLPGKYLGFSNENIAAWNNSRPLDKLATCFLWWRGSLQYRMRFEDKEAEEELRVGLINPHTTIDSTNTGLTTMAPEYGAMLTEPNIWPIIEIEHPYLNTFIASSTYASNQSAPVHGSGVLFGDPSIAIGAQAGTSNTTPIPTQALTNIGSDFRFYGLLAPPNPVRFKITGFQLWPITAPPERKKKPTSERSVPLLKEGDASTWF